MPKRAPKPRYERLQDIRNILLRERTAHTDTLAAMFGKSTSMIRRDFKILVEEGLAKSFRGGISLKTDPAISYAAFADTGPEADISAVKAIAQLVRDDQLVILDWGNVSLKLAQYISKELCVTVFTNSPAVAMAFSALPKVKVRVIGGVLNDGVLTPTEEEETKLLERSRPDLCVLGLCNIDLKKGITTSDLKQAKLRGEMMSNAAKVVVSVSKEKVGSGSHYFIGPLDRITHIIADSSISNRELKPFKDSGIKIVRG